MNCLHIMSHSWCHVMLGWSRKLSGNYTPKLIITTWTSWDIVRALIQTRPTSYTPSVPFFSNRILCVTSKKGFRLAPPITVERLPLFDLLYCIFTLKEFCGLLGKIWRQVLVGTKTMIYMLVYGLCNTFSWVLCLLQWQKGDFSSKKPMVKTTLLS